MSVTTFGPRVLGRREDMQLTMQSLFLTGQILPRWSSLMGSARIPIERVAAGRSGVRLRAAARGNVAAIPHLG
jgi:hypothetical protein